MQRIAVDDIIRFIQIHMVAMCPIKTMRSISRSNLFMTLGVWQDTNLHSQECRTYVSFINLLLG